MSLIQRSYLSIRYLVALVAVGAPLSGVELQAAQTPDASQIDAIASVPGMVTGHAITASPLNAACAAIPAT